MVLGSRIPKAYIVTSGFGQTDEGSGEDPHETGSFDEALVAAGLGKVNLVKYSSVLPPEAEEVPLEVAAESFHHGAVMDAIVAAASGERGDVLVAALGRMDVYDQESRRLGGFAVEFMNRCPGGSRLEAEAKAEDAINRAMEGVFQRRYRGKGFRYERLPPTIISGVVEKKYGTALAVIGWVSYIHPVLGETAVEPAEK
ncbi:pyruvoyl-dependent arginine decarboxylase [Sorangium sp. So ce131]|uniref:pyruvoyl-dependent arginine decarboxylase n=1 Tax=Sorangium sp. So ce131 TaxID=3133282 RepID=UPI003F617E01